MLALGDKIQRMRVWRGITQTELASGLVTPSMISQIEANKANPSTELLLNIIERLNLSVESFLKDVYMDLGGKGMYRFSLELMVHEQYGAALHFLKQLEEKPNLVDPNELMYQLAVCLQHTGKVKEAIEKLDNVLTAIMPEDNREFTARVLYQLGDAYYSVHNLSLAIFYAQKADTILNGLAESDRYLQARVKNLLGVVNSRFGNYQKAADNHEEAYHLYMPTYVEKAAGMLMNLGIEYKNLEDYNKSRYYFEKSLELFKDLPVKKDNIATKHNFAILLVMTAEYELALKYFKEALAEFRDYNMLEAIPVVYSEMAQMELKKRNFTEAKAYVQKGIEHSGDEHYERAYLYQVMAEILLEEGELEESIKHLERAIAVYQKYSRLADLVKTLPLLSKCYQQLGDVEKAVSALEQSKVYIKNLY